MPSTSRGRGFSHLLRAYCVHGAGANDERSQDKIKGLTLAGAYVDEVSTVPQSFYQMLLSRLSVEGAQLFGTTNPEGPAHWLKKDYLDKASVWLDHDGTEKRNPEGLNLARFSRSGWSTTRAPSPGVRGVAPQEFSRACGARMIEGLWVVAEGAVYDMFDEDVHVVAECLVIKRFICASGRPRRHEPVPRQAARRRGRPLAVRGERVAVGLACASAAS